MMGFAAGLVSFLIIIIGVVFYSKLPWISNLFILGFIYIIPKWMLIGLLTAVVFWAVSRFNPSSIAAIGIFLISILCSFNAVAAMMEGYRSWGRDDCKALIRKNDIYCKSSDCKAIIRGNDIYCNTDDCKAVLRRNDIYCKTDNCKAIIRGNDIYCKSSDCRAYVRNNDIYCSSDACKAIIRGQDIYCR